MQHLTSKMDALSKLWWMGCRCLGCPICNATLMSPCNAYPELVGRRARARLVVLAGDVAGRWSKETRAFSCCWHEQTWKMKWWAMLSCAAARTFAALLLFFFSRKEKRKVKQQRKSINECRIRNNNHHAKPCVTRVPDHFSSRGRWTITTLRCSAFQERQRESTSAGANQNHAPPPNPCKFRAGTECGVPNEPSPGRLDEGKLVPLRTTCLPLRWRERPVESPSSEEVMGDRGFGLKGPRVHRTVDATNFLHSPLPPPKKKKTAPLPKHFATLSRDPVDISPP